MTMSVAKAAQVWEDSKREIDPLKRLMDEAAKVLKEHFRKTKRSEYRGRIGYAKSAYMAIDTEKVKAEHVDDLEKFQKPVTRETLSLLKP